MNTISSLKHEKQCDFFHNIHDIECDKGNLYLASNKYVNSSEYLVFQASTVD